VEQLAFEALARRSALVIHSHFETYWKFGRGSCVIPTLRAADAPLAGPRSTEKRLSFAAYAEAKRLLFLDSDDWVAPDFLSRLGAALDAQPSASAAYCAYQRVTPRGLLTKPRLPAAKTWLYCG
jgi:hypothetical protein